jgi:hypothetical protein
VARLDQSQEMKMQQGLGFKAEEEKYMTRAGLVERPKENMQTAKDEEGTGEKSDEIRLDRSR